MFKNNIKSETDDRDLLTLKANELFGQAADQYYREKYGEPKPLDKSFMKSKKYKKASIKRLTAIAAAVVILVGATAVLDISLGSGQVYGKGGLLHRIYETTLGLGTNTDPFSDEEVSVKTIYDMKDIDEAKKAFRRLHIPEYIPEGFTLETMVLKRYGYGVTNADYTFVNEEKKLYIGFTYMDSENATFGTQSEGEMIRLEDRIIYVLGSGEGVNLITDDGTAAIFGDISQEEMIKIAEELKS